MIKAKQRYRFLDVAVHNERLDFSGIIPGFASFGTSEVSQSISSSITIPRLFHAPKMALSLYKIQTTHVLNALWRLPGPWGLAAEWV